MRSFAQMHNDYLDPDRHDPALQGPEDPLDWNSAEYIGDGDAGAYHGAVWDGAQWFAWVDVDTETFCDNLPPEPCGDDRNLAEETARRMAEEWWADNQ